MVLDCLNKLTREFADSGSSSPRRDAELILAQVLNCETYQLYSKHDGDQTNLSLNQLTLIENLAARRKRGESVAYILGYRDFYKSRFEVGPGVLVPRPETELLVDWGLKEFWSSPPKILDLGCGSGCIGLSLLLELPGSSLTAVDISSKAMEFAQKNAQKLQLTNRVDWFLGSVESFAQNSPSGAFDLVVANPPYIDPEDPDVESGVRLFEPYEALFAPEKGFAAIKEFSNCALAQLSKTGVYLLEIGSGQRPGLESWLCQEWPQQLQVSFLKDYSGVDRICKIKREERTNG